MIHRTALDLRLLVLFLVVGLIIPSFVLADTLVNPLGDTNTLSKLIVNVTRALIGFVAIAASFMFVYGGITMLTSAGNARQVERAKEVLRWTTIGLVIIFLSGAILNFVGAAISGSGN